MGQYFIATFSADAEKQCLVGSLLGPDHVPIHPWTFHQGIPYAGPLPLRAEERSRGSVTDWLWTVDKIPLVGERARSLLSQLCPQDFELLPLELGSRASPLSVLNIVALRDCIDPKRRVPMRLWHEYDQGSLTRFPMHIDESKVEGADLLRAQQFQPAVIVSERLRKAFEEAEISGISFLTTF